MEPPLNASSHLNETFELLEQTRKDRVDFLRDGVYNTLKANRKQIRQDAEDVLRTILATRVANPANISPDEEITVLFPLQKQTSTSSVEDKKNFDLFNKHLLDKTKKFIQLYSLMFRVRHAEQYDRAVAILAAGRTDGGPNDAQIHHTREVRFPSERRFLGPRPGHPQLIEDQSLIKHNCFSHMRVTKNKKMGDKATPVDTGNDGRGAFTLFTGLGSGGMKVVVPIIKTVRGWGDGDSEPHSAEGSLVIRPNIPVGSHSWGEKIFIEFFLPFLEDEDISLDSYLSGSFPPDRAYIGKAEIFE